MLTIELSHLKFHSYHGVYEEEKTTGGDFEVNMVVHFQPENIPVLHLNETIDYTSLYELIKERMDHPTPLLETIATELAHDVLNKFNRIEEISISIKKLNPPIPFFNGSVAAAYTTKRIK